MNAYLVFPSIHDVVAAELRLQQQAIDCDMVPTPRAISSSCGMVLCLRLDDLSAAAAALGAGPWRAFYDANLDFRPL